MNISKYDFDHKGVNYRFLENPIEEEIFCFATKGDQQVVYRINDLIERRSFTETEYGFFTGPYTVTKTVVKDNTKKRIEEFVKYIRSF